MIADIRSAASAGRTSTADVGGPEIQALESKLQKLLVHVILTCCAVERATDLIGCVGCYEEWTQELRQIALTLSQAPGGLKSSASLGGDDYVVVWQSADDSNSQPEGAVGVVDWHTVSQVLRSGKALFVDEPVEGIVDVEDISVIESPRGRYQQQQPPQQQHHAQDADDISELSLDDVEGEVSMEQQLGSAAYKRRTSSNDFLQSSAPAAPSRTASGRQLLSGRSVASMNKQTNVLVVPVTVPVSTSSKTGTTIIGAIQFTGAKADKDLVRVEVMDRFRSWIGQLGTALHSRHVRYLASKAATSLTSSPNANTVVDPSSFLLARFAHYQSLGDILRANACLDSTVLKDISKDAAGSSDSSDDGEGGRINPITAQAESTIAPFEAASKLGEMLASTLRADCCVFLQNTVSGAGGALGALTPLNSNALSGRASYWSDGFARSDLISKCLE